MDRHHARCRRLDFNIHGLVRIMQVFKYIAYNSWLKKSSTRIFSQKETSLPKWDSQNEFATIFFHGWVRMDGQLPHPDQAGLRIFRNGTFHHLQLHSSTEKNTPASNVKVWVVVLESRKVLGVNPALQPLGFFGVLGAAVPEKNGKKSGFSQECQLGILIIRIISYNFLVTFPGF